jgi:ligand-binding sensor domain-containing protein
VTKNVKKTYTSPQRKHLSVYLLFASFFLLSHASTGQNKDIRHYYSLKEVINFIKSSDVIYWSNSAGIFKKDLKSNRVDVVRMFTSIKQLYPQFLGFDEKEHLWIRNPSFLSYSTYDGNTWKDIDTLFVKNAAIPLKEITRFFIDNKKQKWLFSNKDKLYLINGDQLSVFENVGYHGLKTAGSSMYVDKTGRLWLAIKEKVLVLDTNKKKFESIEINSLFEKMNERYITITSLAIDNENDIWLGFLATDIIARYSQKSASWEIFSGKEYISSTNKIFVDSKNNKWFANANGLLKYDNENWHLIKNSSQLGSLSSLQLDELGNIWVTSINGSIYRLENDKFVDEIPSFNPLGNNYISNIFHDNHSIWLSSKHLHRLRKSKWENFNFRDLGLRNHKSVMDFKVDKCNDKWFGTTTGIFRLVNNQWAIYDRRTPGILNDYINSFDFDNKNRLWLGTREGLYSHDEKSWSRQIINNIPRNADFIKFVKKDIDGNIWVQQGEYFASWYKVRDSTWCLYSEPIDKIEEAKQDDCENLFFLASNKVLTTEKGEICVSDYKLPSFNKTKFTSMCFDKKYLWILLSNGNFVKSSKEGFTILQSPLSEDLTMSQPVFTVFKSKVYFSEWNGLYIIKFNSLKVVKNYSDW